MSDAANRPCRKCDAQHGEGYTDEQFAFLLAVEDHKKRTRRKFLATVEYLEILQGMGYRKEAGRAAA